MKFIVKFLAALAVVGLVAAGCSDDSSDDTTPDDPEVTDDGSDAVDDGTDDPPADDPPADDPPADDPPVDDPPADDPPADDPPADDPPADDPPAPALDDSGDQVVVDWTAISDVYLPDTPAQSGGTFFHIHSDNAVHDFYLNFELYRDWGAGWSGELGTFEIGCNDPNTDTGICVHYVTADGTNVGEDFSAAGTVTITQLDGDGYEILVSGLTFSDGTTFADFTMAG